MATPVIVGARWFCCHFSSSSESHSQPESGEWWRTTTTTASRPNETPERHRAGKYKFVCVCAPNNKKKLTSSLLTSIRAQTHETHLIVPERERERRCRGSYTIARERRPRGDEEEALI